MLVGLVGFINSGKGTAGTILTEFGFNPLSFAGPLKDATAIIFGWDRSLLEGDTDISREWREQPDEYWSVVMGRPFTPREALQKLGTEGCRVGIHTDIWIHSLFNRLTDDVVVTDVRFENEFNFIHKNKGIIIHVQRGPKPDWWNTAIQANNGKPSAIEQMKNIGIHASEWNWIGCDIDHEIINDGTISELRENILNIIYKFMIK